MPPGLPPPVLSDPGKRTVVSPRCSSFESDGELVAMMKAFATVMLAWAGWIHPGISSAQDFFFVQMADPQFGMYTGNVGFAQETANLELAIATANRLHPAFVGLSDDLVNKTQD